MVTICCLQEREQGELVMENDHSWEHSELKTFFTVDAFREG